MPKRILFILFAVQLIFSVEVLFRKIGYAPLHDILSSGLSVLFVMVFFVAIYRGWTWARLTYMVFLGIGAVFTLLYLIGTFSPIKLLLLLYHLCFFYVLGFDKSMLEFLNHQKERYRRSD
ncbi:MAG: hypothetical protein AAF492_08575 [Verrucomicrobiota bacterium]